MTIFCVLELVGLMSTAQLDYYDVSLEILSVYLQTHPESAIAINLKACNHFRLYNGACEAHMHTPARFFAAAPAASTHVSLLKCSNAIVQWTHPTTVPCTCVVLVVVLY